MANCPYCSAEIIDDLNFCVECEQQVKCLECNSLLYKNKTLCLKCGKAVQAFSPNSDTLNRYTLEEKATKSSSYRRIEVLASDSAVTALMGKLPLGANMPIRPIAPKQTAQDETPPALPSGDEHTITVDPENGRDDTDIGSNAKLGIHNLFSEHSDYGVTPSKTLRDYIYGLPTKKHRQQVFAILFVWAQQERFKELTPHANLVAAMKHQDLYDSNTSNHLASVINDYFRTVDNQYEINPYDGAKRIEEILQEIQQPPAPTEQRKMGKKGRLTGSLNKKDVEAVQPWLDIALPKNLEEFDARQLTSAAEWGAFGLYLLTKILKVEQAISAGHVYVYLTQKFSVMSYDRENFVKRMGDSRSKKFKKNAGGAYFLTPGAEKSIKEIVEASSKP